MRYRDANSQLRSHIMTMRGVIAFLCLMVAGLWHGWQQAKQDIRIHIPPDLRSGTILAADELNPANVYGFANYIFQQGNNWPTNGAKDYGAQIFRLSAYLTPEFRAYLQSDMELRGKRGELAGRTRTIQAIPGHGYEERRVELLSNSVWIVWLDYNIREYVRGMEVKNVTLRYPIRVVRYAVDPETNPWGLALAGFAGEGPRHLTEAEAKEDAKVVEPIS